MHILVVNDDGPPSPHSSPYVHSLVRALQAAGHVVSVCLPNAQRSWIGKAHMIGQTVKPTYYQPPPPHKPAAGLTPSPPPSSASTPAGDVDDSAHGTVHTRPSTRTDVEEWILVDGTPASCAQIGLYHFFQDRGPIDLVLSGPNYGRNTTAVFALSSGTLGGALEAALCRRTRAIALSYAFVSRKHDPAIIAAASRHSVAVVEALVKQWPADGSVDVYTVNVPLLEGVEKSKVLFTEMLQNYWSEDSCFTEVEGSVDGTDEDEERIREAEGAEGPSTGANGDGGKAAKPHAHKHFKWSPKFTDVYKSVEEAPPGNDGWAVKEGHTSVTPLKANFWHPASHLNGQELKLSASIAPEESAIEQDSPAVRDRIVPIRTAQPKQAIHAIIAYEDKYVQPLILSAMNTLFPSDSWHLITPPSTLSSDEVYPLEKLLPTGQDKIIQITPYERIDFDFAMMHPHTCLINSYMIRKALIRKHFLSATVDSWVTKHPESVLRTHVKRSEAFEVDYAEFLDDALIEAFDLRASLNRNAELEEDGLDESASENPESNSSTGGLRMGKNAEKKEWWILKPSMSDRGQGIRIFSTMDELQAIFDEWDAELSDSDDDEEEVDDTREDEGGAAGPADDPESHKGGKHQTPSSHELGDGGQDSDNEEADGDKDYITTSHLRHFVAQPYVDPPLLLPELGNCKFHIRTYVLALGSLRVYVYRDMLALFAAKPYQPPVAATSKSTSDGSSTTEIDLDAHLTNTCLQDARGNDISNSVHRFWDLPLAPGLGQSIFDQICAISGELFEAAARGMVIHFQPLEQAFEVFGLDFLVDADGTAWLLEVNAFPDFKQTGNDLHDVVAGFWTGVLSLAVGPFLRGEAQLEGEGGGGEKLDDAARGMVLVKDVDLGRRWGMP